jgi:hypothetical protein
MAKTRRVGQGTERDDDHDVECNRLEKALEIGLEKTFPASDAVAVIEGADHHPTGSRDLEHL